MGVLIFRKDDYIIYIDVAELSDLLSQDVVSCYLEDACRISESEWKSSELILSSFYRERCFLTVEFSEHSVMVAGL